MMAGRLARGARLAVVTAALLVTGCATAGLLGLGALQDHIDVDRPARRLDGRLYIPLMVSTRHEERGPILGTRRMWMEVDVERTLRGNAEPREHPDGKIPDLTNAELVPVVTVRQGTTRPFDEELLDGSPRCAVLIDEPCYRLHLAVAPSAKPPCGFGYVTGDIIPAQRDTVLSLLTEVATGRSICSRRRHPPWIYPILALGLPATVTFDVLTSPVWLGGAWIIAQSMRE